MRAGKLTVKIMDADCDLLEGLQGKELFCAAKIDECGKMCTETRQVGEPLEWGEDLSFEVGPEASHNLQLMLLSAQPGGEEDILGMGLVSLQGIEDKGKQSVDIALVNRIGKHIGNIRGVARYFPSRNPGAKSRKEQRACLCLGKSIGGVYSYSRVVDFFILLVFAFVNIFCTVLNK